MKIIFGLGNPGIKYKKTWHNLGYLALDRIKSDLNFSNFKHNIKLKAEITEGHLKSEKIILAKPTTYMNNSGQSLDLVCKYFKANLEDILVIHDDIDLDLGRIKIVKTGSAGGHNGVKSIIHSLNSKEFLRIRLGVKTPKLEKVDTADYVLEKIHLLHGIKVNEVCKKASQAVQTILTSSVSEAMNLYN